MRKYFTLVSSVLLFIMVIQNIYSQSEGILNDIGVTVDGTVYAIEVDKPNNLIYIGGDFNKIGKTISHSSKISTTTGVPDFDFPQTDGKILCSVPDGLGGFYIGGEFTKIGDSTRHYLAHVNGQGRVTDFGKDLLLNNSVRAVLLDNNTLYIGGDFTLKDTFTSSAALLDENTATVDRNFPAVNGTVYSTKSDGVGGFYIGGNFTQVGDSLRSNLAHIRNDGIVSSFFSKQTLSGEINTLDLSENTLYIGGSFLNINPVKSSGALISEAGVTNVNFPEVDGSIYAVVPDGIGGFYIGGSFTKVGSVFRGNIAQINSLGEVTDWDPSANSVVSSLAVSGNVVYAGGQFTNIGRQPRLYIAALDGVTGLARDWNPSANGYVSTIAISGTTVYAGGYFTNIGGQNRSYLAALNTTNGVATNWNPAPNNIINTLAVSGDLVYIGGTFTIAGGLARNRIAAVEVSSGVVTTWNPSANNIVNTLAISGGLVYAGGTFTNIGGFARNRIAALETSSSSATTWNPSANSTVNTIFVSGGNVYVGGGFTTIGGKSRSRIAAISATSGIATSWNPSANNVVLSIFVNEGNVFIGGSFSNIGGEVRNRVASLDATTGNVKSWDPSPNNTVRSIAVSNGIIYVGGDFTTISDVTRNRIAAFTATTGLLTSWNPSASASVSTLSVSGDKVFAGGSFTTIGGQNRAYVASLFISNGLATTWNPGANSAVNTIVVSGNTIYVGGGFSTINTQSRSRIAAFDASTGVITSWNPSANSSVNSIAVSGSIVYVSGFFTAIGGQTRNYLAAIDATSGLATGWNPSTNGVVRTLAASGSKVYVGGGFTSIGGQANFIASVDVTTGAGTSWSPSANNTVYALAYGDNTLYAAGNFTSVAGQSRDRIASFSTTTGLLSNWNPIANGQVSSLAVSGNIIYAGGLFTTIGGQLRNRIAALDASTGLASGWNPSSSGEVLSLAVSENLVYAGGNFTNIGGQIRNYLAAIDATTGVAAAWDPTSNGIVNSVVVSGSTIYAGGSFTIIGGQSRLYMAALDVTTGLANSWDPSANGSVNTIALSGNDAFVGGAFTSIGRKTRSGLAAFNITTGVVTDWSPSPNQNVLSIALSGNLVYVGGAFTSIGGQSRNYIAAIDASTGNATNWNPNPNNIVRTIALNGTSAVFAGGDFINIGGQMRNYIAALSPSTGLATTWNPSANNSVEKILVSGTSVYAAGGFTSIGGQGRNYLASLNLTSGAVNTWNPNSNNIVRTLAISGSTLYAGGNFTSIGGQNRNYIAAINTSTGLATIWNPLANNVVYSIAVTGFYAYVGGDFTVIGNQLRPRIAALDLSSGLAKDWDPQGNQSVRAIAVSDKAVYAGGNFTTIANQSKTYFVSLNGLKAPQTITFAALPSKVYGDVNFQLTASSSSGLQVSYRSSNPLIASVSGTTVTIHRAGSTMITAFQAGNMDYEAAEDVSQNLTVNKATPVITWNAPAAITYGTAISEVQLNASTNVPGTFTYTPGSGTLLNAGTHSLSLDFIPNDATNYNSVIGRTVSVTVNKATPAITWVEPSPITYGTALSATQLNATASVAGSFTYTPAAGAILNAGVRTLSVNFTPTDVTNYNVVNNTTVSLTVNKATPSVTWNTPAAITYGTALSSTQLNATASVAGTFTYLPASGTILNAGTHTLSVNFTPTDGVNYNSVNGTTVSLTVNKATPTVTWNTPAAITYGTVLSATQLNATASVPGTFTYTPASGTVLNAGTHTLSVNFAPTDGSNYNSVNGTTVSLTVNKATPTITWNTPAAITYGTALSSTQLNATASVPGTFTYTPASGTVLNAGTFTLSVNFVPTDGSNYNSVNGTTVSLTVNKATPTITWNTPGAITYGSALSSTQLNATGSVPGSFSYTPASGTILNAGTHTLSGNFTPTDGANYNTVNGTTVSLTVNKATPTVTWNAPSAITYGTALGTTQLNATASVPGSFAYTPSSGTILNAGTHTLSVNFTPTDGANYNTVNGTTVSLTVNKATPTVTWNTPSAITYGTALSSTQLNATASVPGSFAYTPTSGTILNAGTHTLSVNFTPTDGVNYNSVNGRTVSITVNKATPIVTWNTPAAITYGTALTGTQLNATSIVAGTFTYTPASGTVLNAGNQILSVNFTPTDAANYNAVNGTTVSLIINKATPTITWNNPAAITYGTALSATQLNATASVAGSFTYTPVSGTILNAGSQTLSVSFTPTDAANYNAVNGRTVTLTVNKATPTVVWNTPSAITYGTALSMTQLNATASVTGNFVYTPASGTLFNAGSHTISVNFTPTDATNYNVVNGTTVTLTVSKATPVVTWNTPSPIAYGTALSATQLNATANVAGSFAYTPASGTVLNVGSQTLTVNFTPADAVNYNPVNGRTVTLTVNKANPVITWNTPAAIPYGTPLSATQLNATSNVPGTFTYTPTTGTVLDPGTHTLLVNFSPSESNNYNVVNGVTVSLTVGKVRPTVTWNTPSAITYGTALTSTQLNATANVAGTFSYSPASGTVLSAGTQTLSMVFTPTDPNYSTVTDVAVSLTVNKKTLAATADNKTRSFGENNPLLTISYSGFINGEDATKIDVTPQISTPATMTSNVGTYSIALSGGTDDNYTLQLNNGTLTIVKATQTISLSPIGNKHISDSPVTLPATASSGLSIEYSIISGPGTINGNVVSWTGTGNIVIKAIQNGNGNYLAASEVTDSFNVTDGQQTQTITFPPISTKTFGNPSFELEAVSSSGLPVTFTVLSGHISISGQTVTIIGSGQATIKASQAGNESFLKAEDVTRSFVIEKAKQTINFSTIDDITLGRKTFNTNITSSSGLPVTLSVVSGPAVVSGTMLTLVDAGPVVLMAIQAGNDNYEAATSVQRQFCVLPAKPIITASQTASAIRLTSSSAVNNQWLKDGEVIVGEVSQYMDVNTAGDYSLRVTANGCSNLSDVFVTTSSESTFENKGNIKAFPNPATEVIQVQYYGPASSAITMKIYNSIGIEMGSYLMEKGNNMYSSRVDLRNFTNGLFVIKIFNGPKQQVTSFTKF